MVTMEIYALQEQKMFEFSQFSHSFQFSLLYCQFLLYFTPEGDLVHYRSCSSSNILGNLLDSSARTIEDGTAQLQLNL